MANQQEPGVMGQEGRPDPVSLSKAKKNTAHAFNNNFIDRIEIQAPARESADNVGANNERGEKMQTGLVRWGNTLWWSWTAPASGVVTIDTLGSTFDTYLAVYTGEAVNALRLVAENDNASEVGVGESLVTFLAKKGTEYDIQVGGVFTGGGRGSLPALGSVQLNLVMPPAVSITSPQDGSTHRTTDSITVSVMSHSDAVTNVSLFRGQSFLGSHFGPAKDFVLNNAPPGSNSFFGVATDKFGQVGTSAVVRVLIASAGVTITSPSDDAVFPTTNPITLSAFSQNAGVTNVRFFVDGQFVAEAGNPRLSVPWRSVASGSHRLTLQALDSSGAAQFATPVFFSVAATLFPTGSVWKYRDDGSNQGTNWQTVNFDDSSWKSGRAELGYGDGDEATRVEDNDSPGFNAADTDHYITTYFRHTFVVTNASDYSDLVMNVKRDDGAVVYLNGHEAARFNMNAGPVDHLTLARNAGDDGRRFFQAIVPARLLVETTNIIAVEVHQATADSTDISFEMDLHAMPKIHRYKADSQLP